MTEDANPDEEKRERWFPVELYSLPLRGSCLWAALFRLDHAPDSDLITGRLKEKRLPPRHIRVEVTPHAVVITESDEDGRPLSESPRQYQPGGGCRSVAELVRSALQLHDLLSPTFSPAGGFVR